VIADNQGRIRWYHELDRPLEATDFRTQTYRGKPVLTWWEGRISKSGVGTGDDVVYNSSYEKIASVTAKHGLDGDLHEFELTPRGTASTDVAAWEVAAGDDDAHLVRIGRAPWAGLETVIPIETAAKVVALRAVDAAGHVLAASPGVEH
jgi:hypothetical protein